MVYSCFTVIIVDFKGNSGNYRNEWAFIGLNRDIHNGDINGHVRWFSHMETTDLPISDMEMRDSTKKYGDAMGSHVAM